MINALQCECSWVSKIWMSSLAKITEWYRKTTTYFAGCLQLLDITQNHV